MDERIASSFEYFTKHKTRFINDIVEFTNSPSISTPPKNEEGLLSSVTFISERLRKIPLENVQVYLTDDQPIVFGECISNQDSKPTILFYGHYDVVSIGDPENWKTDPFGATRVGDYIYGRGTSDMKGQIISICAALQSIRSTGDFPCNIKILLEGEEEHYSPSLKPFLESNHSMLECDFCLSPDAGMLGQDIPTIVYSLRGTSLFRLTIIGPKQELHSGMFGGVVHNPAHVLCDLIASLHNEYCQIEIPRFYDPVLPLNEEERSVLKAHPYDEIHFLDHAGVNKLWGERKFSPIERNGRRPVIETIYLHAGAMKPSIPSKAEVGINIRLVPNQTPELVYDQLREFFLKKIPATVNWELEFIGGGLPAQIDRSSRFVGLFRQALEEIWGKEVIYHPHGGSIPAVSILQSSLGVDTILSGSTLPDDNLHGPNERLHLPTWRKFTQALIRFLYSLGKSI